MAISVNKFRILILEDNPERIKFFRSIAEFNVNELTFVNNAFEAIDLLRQIQYDYIFLDHDLGGEENVDIDIPNTGSTVATWIANNPERRAALQIVYIHSLNQVGAEHMYKTLTASGITTIKQSFLEMKDIYK